MTKFKPKAEQMFEAKVQHYISVGDWVRVEEVTKQYEAYLKLIDPMCTYELQHTDEVGEIEVCIHHGNNSKHADSKDPHRPCLTIDPYSVELETVSPDEPSAIEEQQYVLSGEAERDTNLLRRHWPWQRS